MNKITKVMALSVALIYGSFLYGQAGDYSMAVTTATFTPISGATDLNSIEADGVLSMAIPIGFSFDFDGVSYANVRVSSDGFMTFNSAATNTLTNDLDNGAANRRPLIAPLWDDLDGNANNSASKASYVVTGTAPNRVFTFEWLNYEWNWLSSDSVVSFQVKLYETTNEVAFTYRLENFGAISSPSASIGLSGVSSFLSVSNFAAGTPTASNLTETSTIDTVVTDQVLTFTPPACPSPTFGTVTNVRTDSATISFTASASGPFYINYGLAGFTQGAAGSQYDTVTASPFILHGLQNNKTYDFYIQADCGANGQSNWTGPNSFTTLPVCPPPSALADSNITTNSVDLGWQSGGTGPWYVYWGPCGFNQATPGVSIDTVTSKTHTLTGLAPGTAYQYSVFERCGVDLSDTVDGGCIRTLCVKQNLPYTENWNFDFGCFSVADSGTTNDTWMPLPTGGSTNVPGDFDGTGFLIADSDDAGLGTTMNEYLISPQIDASSLTGSLILEFDQWYKHLGSNADVEVWDGTQWVVVLAQTANAGTSFSSMDHQLINVTAYANADFQVRFHYYNANYAWHWAVDNFEVKEINCFSSSSLQGYTIGSDSISINWMPGDGISYGIEYGPAGFTPGGGSFVSTVDTFATANGLTPNTAYDFYITDTCAAGFSTTLGPITIKTTCLKQTLPYTENFATALNCFQVTQNGGSDTVTWNWVADFTDFSGTYTLDGSTGFAFVNSSASGASTMDEILTSGTVDASAISGALILEFDQYYNAGFGDTAAVDVWDGSQWVNIIKQNADVGSWATADHQMMDVSAYANADFKVRFHYYEANFDQYWAVDNFSLTVAPCGIASNLDTGNVLPFSAVLQWNSSATLWNIEWGPQGFFQGSGSIGGGTVIRGVSSNPYTLLGLGSDSCYEYYVQDTCAGIGTGAWVGPFQFCTPPTCPAPKNLGVDVSTITINGADVYWTRGLASNFNVEYGSVGFTLGMGTGVQSTNDTLTLSGLASGTEYEFYVRDSCSATDTSAWAGPFSFVTAFGTNYLQDFSQTNPFAWTEADGRLTNNTQFTSLTSSSWGSGNFANAGTNLAHKVNIYSASQYEWLISPSIYLDPTITNLQAEFDAAMTEWISQTQGYFGADDSLALLISTDNGATWSSSNILWYNDVNDTLDAAGEHFIIPLSAYSGYVKFGFYAGSALDDSPDNDWFVDNFEVRTPRACSPPTALQISNVTTTGATVSWTAGTPGFINAELFLTTGNQPATAGTITNTLNDTVTLTGLSAATAYCVYIVEECVNGFSDTLGPICFSTLCVPQSIPYFEDFNISLGCFTAVDGGSTPDTWMQVQSYNSQTLDGTSFAFVDSDAPGSGNLLSEKLESVQLNATGITGPLILEYDHYYNNISTDSAIIEVYDGSSWNTVAAYNADQGAFGAPAHDSLDISAYANAALQVRFRYEDNNVWAWYWAVDNVAIYEASSCPAPTAISANVLGCDSVELSWSSDAAVNSSLLLYGPKGFTPPAGTVVNNVSSPYVLSGLALNTEYDFYVVDSCAMAAGTNLVPVTFKTDSVGPVLASFSWMQSDTTLNDATVNLDASASTGDGLTYSWSFGNGNNGTGSTTMETYTMNQSYTVVLTVTDRCGNTDDTTITVTVTHISITENVFNAGIDVYPNPSKGNFNVMVSGAASDYTVEVSDLSGKVIFIRENMTSDAEQSINLGEVAQGVYIVRFSGKGLNASQRIMVD